MPKSQPKPIKKAVALRYDKTDVAPTIIGKGAGIVADNILEKAEQAEVPIYEDKELVETLSKIDIGDYIPEELYQVVAQIMVFVSDLDKMKDKVM